MLLFLVGRTAAATLTVGPFGDYATVNEAEAAAVSGDVLEIGAGVYFEVLDPGGRDLTYRSTVGATITATDPCLRVDEGETIEVEGLVFDACGHGIAVSAGATLTVRDTVFSANTCADGCGITASDGATVTLVDTTFSENVAAGYGGSLYAASGATYIVSDTTFEGGAAGYGGAIAFDSTGQLSLDGVTIAGASAVEGGGVWAWGGAIDLVDVTLVGNTASGAGGGAYVGGASDKVRIDGARFVENAAGDDGGGLYSAYSPGLDLSTVAFLGNTATGAGAGFYSLDDAVWIVGSVLVENASGSAGGGAYVDTVTFAAENVSLACNGASSGGGLYVSASDADLTAVLATANDAAGLAIYTSGFTATDNLSWGNGTSEWEGVADPSRTDGNLWANPNVRFLTCDGDWTTDDVAPDAGSLLIDGATTTVDSDGSVGDIGAYGGTWGALLDADADGVTYWADDCHEGRVDAFPGAVEVWYDGTDQDCDGRDDDQDADGYDLADDCADTDAAVSPAIAEVWYDGTDQDCDGNDQDQDVDGYDLADDCADTDAAVNPAIAEVWYDGTDQDCDGNDLDQDVDGYDLADDCDDEDAAISPGRAEAWYDGVDQDCDGNDLDQDYDGAEVADDCDDLDSGVFPGAVEVWYDGVDQDCDDNDLDQDGDGEGYLSDCDDTEPDAYPGALETWYDGVDQDCDGNDDDQDEDGYALADDCDDVDATVHPGAAEAWYDGVDQDCDGNDDDQDLDGWPNTVDCDDTDATVNQAAVEAWYDGVDQDCDGDDDYDQDGDGHAALAEGAGDDCDDLEDDIAPGAVETWYDGIDQDCDGNDEDQDGDGVLRAEDCDDTEPTAFPGATEAWYDGVDQDCDGLDDDQDGDGVLLADDCDDTDAAVVRCVTRIDGGCNTGGSGGGWVLAVAAAALLAGRRAGRRGGRLLLLSASVLSAPLFSSKALALDASGTGRTPVDAGGLLRVGGVTADEAGTLDVALAGGWAGTTAEATFDDGSTAPLLASLATLQVGAGWTFLDGFRIEAGLPVVLGAAVPEGMGPGVGDTWAAVRWAPIRQKAFSFGPVVELVIPTGDPTRLLGGGGVGGTLYAAAGGVAGPAKWAAEVGAGVRAAGGYDRLTFGPEPELRFGGGVRVTVLGPLSVGAEVSGRAGLGAENAVALATTGAEGLFSAGLLLPKVDLMLAAGAGLVDGVGTPDARVILSVRSRILDPGPRADDADNDGVSDGTDRCATEREDDDGYQDDDGCPDLDDDVDGLPDAVDRCPSDPEDRDYVRDDDGCPDLDDDEDGLADTLDRCPREAGPPETNGCPDRDFDGMLDAADACPDAAAIPGSDLSHNDGCPGRVVVFPDRLRLAEPVGFDAGRPTLRPDATALLREVAAVLQRYPDLALVEIGAHVDDAGDDRANLALTQARAEAVKKALVGMGVSADRLVALGYGEARPMAPNDTEVDRARNRRVEFTLLRR